MARYVELADEAIAEFNEAVDWYAGRSRDAAVGFIDAVEGVIARIVDSPQRFPRTYASCRYASMPPYPFQVVFLEEGERLIVVAIAHAKRRPGYWRRRLT
jgi:plasmid stabilization system protein ParE